MSMGQQKDRQGDLMVSWSEMKLWRWLLRAPDVRLWLCVTSTAGPNGAAQLYER